LSPRRARRWLPVAALIVVAAVLTVAGPASAEPFRRRSVAPVRAVTWRAPTPVLDQGGRGTCSVWAAIQVLNIQPGRRIAQSTAERVSDLVSATVVTPTYGPADATRDALARAGYPAGYLIIPGGVDGLLAALRSGPVELDVPFTTGMYATDPDGRWRATGTWTWMAHGVAVRGYAAGRLYLVNSWGPRWGAAGGMWMSVADLRALDAAYPGWMTVTAWTRS
jgi:hypothetical protein